MEFYVRAASTMNYLFLRHITGIEELSDALKSEMEQFFDTLSRATCLPQDFVHAVKTEMDEGGYTEDYTLDEFKELISDALQSIGAVPDQTIFQFYSWMAEELYKTEENLT